MQRTFRAEKMIARLTEEGRMNEVGDSDMALIKFLDGKKGNGYNWESFVNGNPLVWISASDEKFEGKKFDGAYVALCDCD